MPALKTCPVCEDPMKQGQRQKPLPDGRKAHAVCAETYDGEAPTAPEAVTRQMGDEEFVALFEPSVREVVKALLPGIVRAVVEPGLATMVNEAAVNAIAQLDGAPLPRSKSARLAELMNDAAERVINRTVMKDGNSHLHVQDIREMARAATVLRVVALYIEEAS